MFKQEFVIYLKCFYDANLIPFYKLHERRNADHHIQGKELSRKLQVPLKGEHTKNIDTYHL
jgi:hypothetical protein